MICRNRLLGASVAVACLAGSVAGCGGSSGGKTDAGASTGTITTDGTSCEVPGPGVNDCGANKESCCTSIPVPGGMFYRSYGTTMQGNLTGGTLGDPATVSAYRLDKYLVTVGRFRRFIAALTGQDGGVGWTPAPGSGKHTHLNGNRGLDDSGSPGLFEPGWDANDNATLTADNLSCDLDFATWTSATGANENLPINCVNWPLAYAFCIWDGGFLPTENEFEFATAGGGQQRVFPWGTMDPGTTPSYAVFECNYNSTTGDCTGVTNIAPVGSATLGVGAYGHLDLAGELNEWLLDYNAGYVTPCIDCAFLTHASGREVRGGYFQSSSQIEILSSYRNEGLYPTNNYKSNGFRCARTPD